MEPIKQWVRERLPNGRCGVTYCADDGIMRAHQADSHDDLGMWAPVEFVSNGADLDYADHMTLRAMQSGPPLRAMYVRFDGDVPTFLYHWPKPCECCGAPGPLPRPSSWVVLTFVGGRQRTLSGKYRTVPKEIVKLRPETLAERLISTLGHRL